jgi:hypothetical protein
MTVRDCTRPSYRKLTILNCQSSDRSCKLRLILRILRINWRRARSRGTTKKSEAIPKMISLQPPRSETEKLIADLEREIADLEAENVVCIRTLELRKKQFPFFCMW